MKVCVCVWRIVRKGVDRILGIACSHRSKPKGLSTSLIQFLIPPGAVMAAKTQAFLK